MADESKFGLTEKKIFTIIIELLHETAASAN